MIDSQFPQMTDKIVAAINQINPAPIKNEQWEDGPINSEQLLTLTYQALTLQN